MDCASISKLKVTSFSIHALHGGQKAPSLLLLPGKDMHTSSSTTLCTTQLSQLHAWPPAYLLQWYLQDHGAWTTHAIALQLLSSMQGWKQAGERAKGKQGSSQVYEANKEQECHLHRIKGILVQRMQLGALPPRLGGRWVKHHLQPRKKITRKSGVLPLPRGQCGTKSLWPEGEKL